MKLRIKQVAKRKGFTMARLSQVMGIDTTTLSRYNTGAVEPPLSRLYQMAGVLNCEVAELLPLSDQFGHWEIDGEWLGIRKK
ncbi:helix-turn-helix domain-containing protein [Chryseobacterium arthrosphaerae]|uniref:helix-turn-helix domain-containing protein n=1 Tax=Chryseobacterium arthrosphaerae TaxID=651561 RepID=UPI00241BF383|nr:helix-turn-helix transcriptional regulator [Chryseobacterium arthrosphaerae]